VQEWLKGAESIRNTRYTGISEHHPVQHDSSTAALLQYGRTPPFRATETEQADCTTDMLVYYSYHATATQHSCSQQLRFSAVFTLDVKENPFNRESISFNRKG